MTVYFIVNEESGAIKIGQARDPLERLRQLQVGNASTLKLLAITDSYEESELHERFTDCHISGEWFRPEAKLMKFIKIAVDRYQPQNIDSTQTLPIKKVLTVIEQFSPVHHKKLHKMLNPRIKAKDLDAILAHLEANGQISTEQVGAEKTYKMPPII